MEAREYPVTCSLRLPRAMVEELDRLAGRGTNPEPAEFKTRSAAAEAVLGMGLYVYGHKKVLQQKLDSGEFQKQFRKKSDKQSLEALFTEAKEDDPLRLEGMIEMAKMIHAGSWRRKE